MHAQARVHMHAHTHREICNTYCFSTAIIIRERALMLRYTYVACLVYSFVPFFFSPQLLSLPLFLQPTQHTLISSTTYNPSSLSLVFCLYLITFISPQSSLHLPLISLSTFTLFSALQDFCLRERDLATACSFYRVPEHAKYHGT